MLRGLLHIGARIGLLTRIHPHPTPPVHQVEARLRQLEGRAVNKAASLAKAAAAGAKGTPKAYDPQRQGAAPQLLTTPKGYNAAADVVHAPAAANGGGEGDEDDAEARAARKAAKKAKREREAAAQGDNGHAAAADAEDRPKKKKKKDKGGEE